MTQTRVHSKNVSNTSPLSGIPTLPIQGHSIESSTSKTGLPPDLISDAARRLSRVSIIYAIGCSIFYTTLLLVTPGFSQRETFAAEATALYGSVVFAKVTFVAARSSLLTPGRLLDYGLMFEVVVGFSIAFSENWGLFGDGIGDWFGISWICAWIIMFPLILPATPGKTLLTALVTATMGPLAYLLSMALGRSPHLPAFLLLRMFFPNYLSALIALLGSKIVYKLSTEIGAARKLGRYELVKLLGRGGMGEVWSAKHRFLSRPSAIKLIRPEALGQYELAISGVVHERFEREAEATSRLRSPHSITIFDFGTSEDGTFYYVMELLEGLDLETLVRKFGVVSPGRVIYILKQVCHSLSDAHAIGLIHRDIKPSNIFLCRLGQDHDFVKVLDFGLVQSKKPWSAHDRPLTTPNVLTGTPAYTPPEMVMDHDELDARADIYSLGCVAYWLLTGQLVFDARSPTEMIIEHVKSDPIPPSRRIRARPGNPAAVPGNDAGSSREDDVPGTAGTCASLEAIVMACLKKRPEERVQSAADLLRELDGCEVEDDWSADSARKWWETFMPQQDSA